VYFECKSFLIHIKKKNIDFIRLEAVFAEIIEKRIWFSIFFLILKELLKLKLEANLLFSLFY